MEDKYGNLRLKLLASMLSFSLVPLFIVGLSLYHQFDRAYTTRVQENLRALVEDRRHALDLFFDERISQLYTVAHTHSFDELCTQSTLQQVFDLMQRRSKYYVDLGVIDEKGNHVAYAGPYALKGVNYRDAEWFQSVLLHGIYVSDVFLGVRQFPHFIIAVLRREGDRYWILRATINTDLFESMVKAAQAGEFGDAFLVNEKNLLQTSSRFVGRPMEAPPIPAQPRFNGSRLMTLDIGQRTMLVGAVWLHNVPWMLVVMEDPQEEFLPVLQTRSLALILLAAGVAVVVLGAVFVVNLMIGQLQEADRQKALLDADLMQTSKMAALGRLAAGIAHEINNPLAVIQEKAGWIQDLLEEEDVQRSENFKEFEAAVTKIQQHVDRARNVTHRLLGFARRMEPVQHPVNMNKLVEETLTFLENEARHRNIQITKELGDNIPDVLSDGAQLQQVILNVVNNAIDAVEKDGRVHIKTRYDKDLQHVLVEISDTGPGIPSELLDKIFDPFFTTKKLGSGTGLGLSICHSIMTKLGGRIEARNGPQGGAVFVLSVPVQHHASVSVG